MPRETKPLFSADLVRPAISAAFRKLHPGLMAKNPVMFVTMVGAALTTACIPTAGQDLSFVAQLSVWLWFTVLFSNFAEAMAEGRGKAQADALRRQRSETFARRLREGREERVAASDLVRGDHVVCTAGSRRTATWSKGSPASTNRRSPVSRLPSSARAGATGVPSVAARVCSATASWSGSPRSEATASSTG